MLSSIDELPEAVRKVLQEEGQSLFLAAYNAALEENPGGNDVWAMRTAWTVVGRQYQLNDDDSFDNVTGAAMFTAGSHLEFIEHEAIIQTLDRESNGKFLTKASFEKTVDDWNSAHLIFAQDHPDPPAFDKDPEAELKRIKGRMVDGVARDTHIDEVGHPTLRTVFDLKDKEINDGIAAGKISTSNCFYCPDDGRKLTGTVRPHHILFFYEKEKDVPGDRGVLILNKASGKDGITLIDRLVARFKGRGSERKEEENDMTDKELESKLAVAERSAADAKLAFTQLQADAVKKDEAIAKLSDELAAFKAKEKNDKWNAFKAKHVPPGLVAGEKEAAARKEFDADPVAFMEKCLEFKATESEDDGEEPVAFTSGKAKAKAQETDAELRKVGATSVSYKEA